MKKTAQLFKALSDETRLRILGLLLSGELCVCDIMAILELPQSTVSRHLAYLRNNGLVEDRRQGIWMHYRLAGDGSSLQKNLIDLLERYLARLGEVKADQKRLKQHLSSKQAAACCDKGKAT
jgi:ArsR family transcriptional regulator